MEEQNPFLQEILGQGGKTAQTLDNIYGGQNPELPLTPKQRILGKYNERMLLSTPTEFLGYQPDLSTYRQYGIEYNPFDPAVSEERRAIAQPFSQQLWRGTAKILPNIFYDLVGNTGAILDIPDYLNTDEEIGNALTEWADEQRRKTAEANPIYARRNSGIGDSAWWIENGAGLVSSMASFAITGGVVGRGLSSIKWLNALTKGRTGLAIGQEAAQLNQGVTGISKFLTPTNIQNIQKAQNISNRLLTSTMLNQAEAMQSATQSFSDAYDLAVSRGLSDDRAKEIAASAASHVINANRANIALNMTSAGLFLKSPQSVRSAAKRRAAMGLDAPKPAGFFGKTAEFLKKHSEIGLEAGQEAWEELVNLQAELSGAERASEMITEGKEVGFLDGLFDGTLTKSINLLGTKEGQEAAFWGAIGGAGQTALTTQVIDRIPGQFFGQRVEKRDEKGNIIYKTKPQVWESDTKYEVGEKLTQPITLSDGVTFERGTVVTDEMIDKYENELVHKKGTEKLNPEDDFKPFVERTDTPEYVDDGKYLSAKKAKQIRDNYDEQRYQQNVKQVKDVVNTMSTAQRQFQNVAAVEAIDQITDPTLDSQQKEAYYDYLAKYEINKAKGDVSDANAVAAKVAELKQKSHKDLQLIREQSNNSNLAEMAFNAFSTGNADNLIAIFEDYKKLNPEDAQAAGLNPETYYNDAQTAINKIKTLEGAFVEYNAKYNPEEARALFANRAVDMILHEQKEALENEFSELTAKTQEAHRKSILSQGKQGIEAVGELEALTKARNIDDRNFEELLEVDSKIKDKQKEIEQLSVQETAPEQSESLATVVEDQARVRAKKNQAVKELAELFDEKQKINAKYQQERDKAGLGTPANIDKIVFLKSRLDTLDSEIKKNNNDFISLRDRNVPEIQRRQLEKNAEAKRRRDFVLTLEYYMKLQESGDYGAVFAEKPTSKARLVASRIFRKIVGANQEAFDRYITENPEDKNRRPVPSELTTLVNQEFNKAINEYRQTLDELEAPELSTLEPEIKKIVDKELQNLFTKFTTAQIARQYEEMGVTGTIMKDGTSYSIELDYEDNIMLSLSEVEYFENLRSPSGERVYEVEEDSENPGLFAATLIDGKKPSIPLSVDNYLNLSMLSQEGLKNKKAFENVLKLTRNRLVRIRAAQATAAQSLAEITANINQAEGSLESIRAAAEPSIAVLQEVLDDIELAGVEDDNLLTPETARKIQLLRQRLESLEDYGVPDTVRKVTERLESLTSAVQRTVGHIERLSEDIRQSGDSIAYGKANNLPDLVKHHTKAIKRARYQMSKYKRTQKQLHDRIEKVNQVLSELRKMNNLTQEEKLERANTLRRSMAAMEQFVSDESKRLSSARKSVKSLKKNRDRIIQDNPELAKMLSTAEALADILADDGITILPADVDREIATVLSEMESLEKEIALMEPTIERLGAIQTVLEAKRQELIDLRTLAKGRNVHEQARALGMINMVKQEIENINEQLTDLTGDFSEIDFPPTEGRSIKISENKRNTVYRYQKNNRNSAMPLTKEQVRLITDELNDFTDFRIRSKSVNKKNGITIFSISAKRLSDGEIVKKSIKVDKDGEVTKLVNLLIRKQNELDDLTEQYESNMSVYDALERIPEVAEEVQRWTDIARNPDKYITPTVEQFNDLKAQLEAVKARHDLLVKHKDHILELKKLNRKIDSTPTKGVLMNEFEVDDAIEEYNEIIEDLVERISETKSEYKKIAESPEYEAYQELESVLRRLSQDVEDAIRRSYDESVGAFDQSTFTQDVRSFVNEVLSGKELTPEELDKIYKTSISQALKAINENIASAEATLDQLQGQEAQLKKTINTLEDMLSDDVIFDDEKREQYRKELENYQTEYDSIMNLYEWSSDMIVFLKNVSSATTPEVAHGLISGLYTVPELAQFGKEHLKRFEDLDQVKNIVASNAPITRDEYTAVQDAGTVDEVIAAINDETMAELFREETLNGNVELPEFQEKLISIYDNMPAWAQVFKSDPSRAETVVELIDRMTDFQEKVNGALELLSEKMNMLPEVYPDVFEELQSEKDAASADVQARLGNIVTSQQPIEGTEDPVEVEEPITDPEVLKTLSELQRDLAPISIQNPEDDSAIIDSWRKAAVPGKTQQSDIKKALKIGQDGLYFHPVTGSLMWEDDIENGLPQWTESPQAKAFSIAINSLAPGRKEKLTVNAKPASLYPSDSSQEKVRVRFLLATDPELEGTLASAGDVTSNAFEIRGLNVDSKGRIYVGNKVKLDTYLTNYASEFPEERKKILETFANIQVGSPSSDAHRLTIDQVDMLFRYDLNANFIGDLKVGNKTYPGVGIVVALTDQKGNILRVNDANQAVTEKKTGHLPLLSHIPRPRYINTLRVKENISAFSQLPNGDQIKTWKEYRRDLVVDYARNVLGAGSVTIARELEAYEKDPTITNKIVVPVPGWTGEKITVWDLDNMEDTFAWSEEAWKSSVSDKHKNIYRFIKSKLKAEVIDSRNEYRQRIFDSLKSGEKVFVKDDKNVITMSPGLPVRRPVIAMPVGVKFDTEPLIGSERSVLDSKEEVVAWGIHEAPEGKDYYGTITVTDRDGNPIRIQKEGRKGGMYMLLDDGTLIHPFVQSISEKEVDFVIDAIEAEFGRNQEEKTVTVLDEDGNVVTSSIGDNVGLIRKNTTAKAKPISMISRIVHWSGFRRPHKRTHSTMWVGPEGPTAKLYVHYGPFEKIAVTDLKRKSTEEYRKFREWLSTRRRNVINEDRSKAYYHPVSLSVTGNNIEVTAKRYDSYLDYLLDEGILSSDVLSKKESRKAGGRGERTANRYLIFGERKNLDIPSTPSPALTSGVVTPPPTINISDAAFPAIADITPGQVYSLTVSHNSYSAPGLQSEFIIYFHYEKDAGKLKLVLDEGGTALIPSGTPPELKLYPISTDDTEDKVNGRKALSEVFKVLYDVIPNLRDEDSLITLDEVIKKKITNITEGLNIKNFSKIDSSTTPVTPITPIATTKTVTETLSEANANENYISLAEKLTDIATVKIESANEPMIAKAFAGQKRIVLGSMFNERTDDEKQKILLHEIAHIAVDEKLRRFAEGENVKGAEGIKAVRDEYLKYLVSKIDPKALEEGDTAVSARVLPELKRILEGTPRTDDGGYKVLYMLFGKELGGAEAINTLAMSFDFAMMEGEFNIDAFYVGFAMEQLPFNDLREFVAAIFEDSDLQKELDSIDSPSARKSFFKQLIDAFRRLFGISAKEGKLLYDALNSVAELIGKETPTEIAEVVPARPEVGTEAAVAETEVEEAPVEEVYDTEDEDDPFSFLNSINNPAVEEDEEFSGFPLIYGGKEVPQGHTNTLTNLNDNVAKELLQIVADEEGIPLSDKHLNLAISLSKFKDGSRLEKAISAMLDYDRNPSQAKLKNAIEQLGYDIKQIEKTASVIYKDVTPWRGITSTLDEILVGSQAVKEDKLSNLYSDLVTLFELSSKQGRIVKRLNSNMKESQNRYQTAKGEIVLPADAVSAVMDGLTHHVYKNLFTPELATDVDTLMGAIENHAQLKTLYHQGMTSIASKVHNRMIAQMKYIDLLNKALGKATTVPEKNKFGAEIRGANSLLKTITNLYEVLSYKNEDGKMHNWSSFISTHALVDLRTRGVIASEDLMDEMEFDEDFDESDMAGARNNDNFVDRIKYSAKDMAPPIIKMIMASIPRTTLKDGKLTYVMNNYGLQSLHPSNRVWNLALKSCAGSEPTMEAIVAQFRKAAKSEASKVNGIHLIDRPIDLLEKVKDPKSSRYIDLASGFIQTFAKYEGRHFNIVVDGKSFYISDENIAKSRAQLRRMYKSDLMRSVSDFNKSLGISGTNLSPQFIKELTRLRDSGLWQNDAPLADEKSRLEKAATILGLPSNFDEINPKLSKSMQSILLDIIFTLDQNKDKSISASSVYDSGSLLSRQLNTILNVTQHLANAVDDIRIKTSKGRDAHPIQLPDFLTMSASQLNAQRGNGKILEALPQYDNPWSSGSIMLNRVKDGDDIVIATVNGSKILGDPGMEFADMSPKDKLAATIHLTLGKGIYLINQAADRRRTNAILLGSDKPRDLLVSNRNDAVIYMRNHLISEMVSVRRFIIDKVGIDIDVYNRTAGDLRYFYNILNADTRDQIMKLALGTEEPTLQILKRNEPLYNAVTEQIESYLKLESKKVYDALSNNGSLKPKMKGESVVFGNIDFEGYADIDNSLLLSYNTKSNDPHDALQSLVDNFTDNQVIAFIEMSKIFFGDPAFFGNEDNVNKRVKMFNSSHKASIVGEEINTMLQENRWADIVTKNKDGETRERVSREDLISGKITLKEGQTLDLGSGFRMDGKTPDGILRGVTLQDIEVTSLSANDNVDNIELRDGKITYLQVYKRNEDGDITKEKLESAQVAKPSMLRRTFAESFVKEGVSPDKLFYFTQSALKPYLKFDEGDAQGWISLDEYRELLMRSGLSWTSKHEQAYARAVLGQPLSSTEIAMFPPLKTQQVSFLREYANVQDRKKRLFVPVGYKHSLMPILPSIVNAEGNELLKSISDYMTKNQVGIVQFVTANKFGAKNPGNIFDQSTWNIQSTSYEHIGIQVQSKFKRSKEITPSSQQRKNRMVNTFEAGKPREGFNKGATLEAISTIIDLENARVSKNMDSLRTRVGVSMRADTEGGTKMVNTIAYRGPITEAIKREALNRGEPTSMIEAVERLMPGFSDAPGGRAAYVEEIVQRGGIDALLHSIVNNRVVKKKMPGESFIQAASIGLESGQRMSLGKKKVAPNPRLRFYRWGTSIYTGEYSLLPADVIVPLPPEFRRWTLELGEGDHQRGLTVLNNMLSKLHEKLERIEEAGSPESLEDDERNLLMLTTVVSFRIPHQDQGSTDVLRIKEFLDPAHCNLCIIPPEMVPKVGSDFDFDKANTSLPTFRFQKGSNVPKYVDFNSNEKFHIDNEYAEWKSEQEAALATSNTMIQEERKAQAETYSKFDQLLKESGPLGKLLKDRDPETLGTLRNILEQRDSMSVLEGQAYEIALAGYVMAFESLINKLDNLGMSREVVLSKTVDSDKILIMEFFDQYDELTKKNAEHRKRLNEILKDANITREAFSQEFASNRSKTSSLNAIDNQILLSSAILALSEANAAAFLAPVSTELYTSTVQGEEGIAWDARFLRDKQSPITKEYVAERKKVDFNYTGNQKEVEKSRLYKEYLQKYIDAYTKQKGFTGMLSPVGNLDKAERYLVSSTLIGAVAVNIAHHPLAQMTDVHFASPFIITGRGLNDDNANIYTQINWKVNDGKREYLWNGHPLDIMKSKNETFNGDVFAGYTDPKTGNVFPVGTKFYPSLSGTKDGDGRFISAGLSSMLNGYVDAVKDTYVFDVNGGPDAIGVWTMLERAGAKPAWIQRFLNQPIIRMYSRIKDQYTSVNSKPSGYYLSDKAIQYAVLAEYEAEEFKRRSKSSMPYFKLIRADEWKKLSYDKRTEFMTELKLAPKARMTTSRSYEAYLKMYNNYASRSLESLAARKSEHYYRVLREGRYENGPTHEEYKQAITKHNYPKSRFSYDYRRDQANIESLYISGGLDYDNLGDSIVGINRGSEFNKQQRAVLDFFTELQRQANLVRASISAGTFDTRGIDKNDARLANKLNRNDDISQAGFLKNYGNIFLDTPVAEFKRVARAANSMFSDLHLIKKDVTDKYYDYISYLKRLIIPWNTSPAQREMLESRIDNEFIDFVMHSDFNTGLHVDTRKVYDELVLGTKSKYRINGKSVNLIDFISEIRKPGNVVAKVRGKTLKRDELSSIRSNAFIEAANVESQMVDQLPSVSEFFDSKVSTDYKLPSITLPPVSKEYANGIGRGLKELSELQPDIWADIIELNMAQFGVRSPIVQLSGAALVSRLQNQFEFLEQSPKEYVTDVFMPVFLNSFQRRNIDLLPQIEGYDKYEAEGIPRQVDIDIEDIFDFESQYQDVDMYSSDSYSFDSGFDFLDPFDSFQEQQEEEIDDMYLSSMTDDPEGFRFGYKAHFSKNPQGLREMRIFRREQIDTFNAKFKEMAVPVGKLGRWIGYYFDPSEVSSFSDTFSRGDFPAKKSSVTIDGTEFKSEEHYIAYKKYSYSQKSPNDFTVAVNVLTAPDAETAKAIANSYSQLNGWTKEVEEELRKQFLASSFNQNPQETLTDKPRPEFDTLPFRSDRATGFYAGIGSRETPAEVQTQMERVAGILAERGYTLRSGGAEGADQAFERGAAKKEIFQGMIPTGEREKRIAHEIHPDLKAAMEASKSRKVKAKLEAGATLSEAEKSGERSAWAVENLMARNTNQVFGKNLDTPVDFVLAWTRNGEESFAQRTASTGGTGQAIELASRKGIPVINLANPDWEVRLNQLLDKLGYNPNVVTTYGKEDKINIYSTDRNGFEGLSNLLNGPVTDKVNGRDYTFKTVEHLFQARKAEFAGDRDTANEIVKATTGWDAQRLGKKVKGLDSKAWDAVSSGILENAMNLAFMQNKAAANLLLSTGQATLTHTSSKYNLGKWETEFPNILMRIRTRLQKSATSPVFDPKQFAFTELNSTENIYSQLGNTTESGNVELRSWKDELEKASSPVVYSTQMSLFDEKQEKVPMAVVSTRIKGTNQHFGNPFSSDERVLKNNKSLIKTDSTQESVENYIDWVLGNKFTEVEPERRQWIVERLRSGELKNLPIYYYAELNEASHANALDYLINQHSWVTNVVKRQKGEYTPDDIKTLSPNEIIVFGSNKGSSKGGRPTHGKGLAKIAKERFGAVQGQSEGRQGQSYAIVTKKHWDVPKSSTIAEIQEGILKFYDYAIANPDLKFYMTKIGSGNAGYTTEEMAKAIRDVGDTPSNVILPVEYEYRDDTLVADPDSILNKMKDESTECTGD